MAGTTVLSVASELFPLVKTGGLADVAGALPPALAAEGVRMATLVPGYPAVLAGLVEAAPVLPLPGLFGGDARLVAGRAAGLELFVLDAPHLYARPGGPYQAPDGQDWPDNAFRFAALAQAAARIGTGAVAGFVPDVVHGHDWQAGLVPAYLADAGGRRPATLATIHNIAFQGIFPRDLLGLLGLPERAFTIDGVEFYGSIGFLKAGLALSDHLSTVSPTYALEIQTPEFGCGLDGLLRARAGALSGVLNGIDTSVWDPARDPRIVAPFDRDRIAERAGNRAALLRRFGLADEGGGGPLFGVVSRLSWQKGLDLLAEALPVLLETGGRLVLLGSGEAALEQRFRHLAAAHAGRIGCVIGYDEDLAHLLQAGVDALIVPSRFEPCGLTQLCALRYGALPVVARVGGLLDSVVDAGEMARAAGAATGLQFAPVTSAGLALALRRAAVLWRDAGAWARIQAAAMATDVSWAHAARHYAALYRRLRP